MLPNTFVARFTNYFLSIYLKAPKILNFKNFKYEYNLSLALVVVELKTFLINRNIKVEKCARGTRKHLAGETVSLSYLI